MTKEQLIENIFRISSVKEFNELSLKIFYYQYQNNRIYQKYCSLLRKTPENIESHEQIPFLPVNFFKTHIVKCENAPYDVIFKSSGTTSANRSRHYVTDLSLYIKSFRSGFDLIFGNPEEYTFLALLPGYLERKNSSLIYMVDHLISCSRFKEDSGFYLNNHEELFLMLTFLASQKNRKVMLFGVTHALLDFSEKFKISFPELIVMETGGMKGLRKELVREELHEILTKTFNVQKIYSEYGMTELLSQAYSKGNGLFECPPWMNVSLRDPEDPLSSIFFGSGAINITDLANINSCSFIATSDLGKIYENKFFEVLGRIDNADIRGCNLLVNN